MSQKNQPTGKKSGSSAKKTRGTPKPIIAETLLEGAGKTSLTIPSTPLKSVVAAVKKVQRIDLLELAQRLFDIPIIDEEGKPRKQSQNELVVLIEKQFGLWIGELGMGATVLNGSPHLYGGTHWKPASESEFEAIMGDFAVRIGCNPITFGYFTAREKLVKQFLSHHSGQPEEDPTGKTLLNFLNGTLEIDDEGERMRDFDKSDLLTYQLPFLYDRTATCPMFDRYLERVLPDPSSRMVLAEFFGWIFLRDLKLEKMLVLLGDGCNGKSVVFDLMNALLGEQNVCNFGLSSLSKMENRCALGSALLNFGSEINERCDTDILKKMASGEPVEARKLYDDPYIMRRYARLAFNANVLPKDTEMSNGFFRRFLIIPFNETISESEKDPELATKIIGNELSGVFNWVMEGLRRLRSNRKFSPCKVSEEALSNYKKASDSVAGFLEDGCWVVCAESRIGKGELFLHYKDYCRDNGYIPLNIRNFGARMLKTHGIPECKSDKVKFWRLKQSTL